MKRFSAVLAALLCLLAFSPMAMAGAYTGISMAFFNRFPDAGGTDCFQRYHTGVLGATWGDARAEAGYYWYDEVRSAISDHTLTPYNLHFGYEPAGRPGLSLDYTFVTDLHEGRNMVRVLDGRIKTAVVRGPVVVRLDWGARAIATGGGYDWDVEPAVSGTLGVRVGKARVEASYDALHPVDHALLGVGRDVASLRAVFPAWGDGSVGVGLNKALGGAGNPRVPGGVWLDVRLDFGPLVGRTFR